MHGVDQLVLSHNTTMFGFMTRIKKKCLCLIIPFKNHIFYCFFLFAVAKVCVFCCRLTSAAVDSNGLIIFLPSHFQMTARNYIFIDFVYVVYTNF